MESESLFEKLRGSLSRLVSKANLVRVGYLVFLSFVLSGSVVYLSSVNGQDLTANISSVLGRAVSGIFNGPVAGEKFLGAVNLNSDDNERGLTSLTAPVASIAKQKININTATLNELQEITGVGPVTAQKIIDYRKSNSPFYKIEDIQKVSGIGPATFQKMKGEITVGNIAQPVSKPVPKSVMKEQYSGVGRTNIVPGELDQSSAPDSLLPSNQIEPTEVQPAPQVPPRFEKININTATLAELQEITGVGPAIAQKIIEYRNSVSLFYKIEDIINVNGIGEITFQKMKDEITVGNVTPPVVPAAEPPAPTVASEPLTETSPPPPTSVLEPSVEPPPPPPPPADDPPQQNIKVLISEITAGIEDNSDYEFIELYNPTDSPIDLTGWSIKKKSSTGSVSSLVVASRFEGKIVPVGGYLLIAKEDGYNGTVLPDVGWPKSYTLAYTNNAIILYNQSGEMIEEVFWSNIPVGHSFERDSWDSVNFHTQSSPSPNNSQKGL